MVEKAFPSPAFVTQTESRVAQGLMRLEPGLIITPINRILLRVCYFLNVTHVLPSQFPFILHLSLYSPLTRHSSSVLLVQKDY
jgi:hypothetical protein